MTSINSTDVKRLFSLIALATCLTAAPAQAQDVVYPPPEFIATATPVYYEGHAAYWYGNRWCYRDGGDWGYYRDEPAFLGDYRMHHDFGRRFYEGRGYGGGFGGRGGGFGGGRGGGGRGGGGRR